MGGTAHFFRNFRFAKEQVMATQPYSQIYQRSRPLSQTALKIEALLDRYPKLGEQDLDTLIRSYPYLPMVDYALMTADDRLAAKLEAFHRDHGDKLKAPVNAMLAFIAVPALVAVGALWWVLS
jgi:hypothetical protein